jgi:hypothetical protein
MTIDELKLTINELREEAKADLKVLKDLKVGHRTYGVGFNHGLIEACDLILAEIEEDSNDD